LTIPNIKNTEICSEIPNEPKEEDKAEEGNQKKDEKEEKDEEILGTDESRDVSESVYTN
jgi:hypothetical protein